MMPDTQGVQYDAMLVAIVGLTKKRLRPALNISVRGFFWLCCSLGCWAVSRVSTSRSTFLPEMISHSSRYLDHEMTGFA